MSNEMQSSMLTQTDYDREFREHVQHVLEVLGWEQERDTPADQQWFALIANTAILGKMLLDELDPEAEFTKMLTNAVTLFEKSQTEMATYLETPALPTAITEFVESVEQRLAML